MTKERMALFGIIHTVHASFSSLIFLMLRNNLIRDTCNKHIDPELNCVTVKI